MRPGDEAPRGVERGVECGDAERAGRHAGFGPGEESASGGGDGARRTRGEAARAGERGGDGARITRGEAARGGEVPRAGEKGSGVAAGR